MSTYSTNEFRSGLKVMVDNDPCNILENEFVKPGKGQAFNRVRLRNLKTGRVIERTFKSGDSLEGADIAEMEMQYLYSDGEFLHFMDPNSFEQLATPANSVGDAMKWIKEEDVCTVVVWNGHPLTVSAPTFVELKVADADPGVKGD